MDDENSNRDKALEILFERVLREVGGPIVDAHVMCEAGGFLLDKEGMPDGHSNEMLALGIVQSGLVTVRPNDEDNEDNEQWMVMKDPDHTWLSTMLLSYEGARMLADDIYAILSEIDRV